ncbi:hypothetical protein L1987_09328 [Smallanthus sonchifolius]|uniref:Uncharacterized protein n=1 Tax=Smallanthus sonchifolius TaxID=185202 RepID=A0ACB9JPE2_9ASTR|nr:hypothetical protein L1987_09328 [Smallanthus sonchifolius]
MGKSSSSTSAAADSIPSFKDICNMSKMELIFYVILQDSIIDDPVEENINLLVTTLNVNATSGNDSTSIEATKMREKNLIEATNKEDKVEEPDVESSKNESLQAHENIQVDNDENPSVFADDNTDNKNYMFDLDELISAEYATASLLYNAAQGMGKSSSFPLPDPGQASTSAAADSRPSFEDVSNMSKMELISYVILQDPIIDDLAQENINLLAIALNVNATSGYDSTSIDATKIGEKNPIEAANKEESRGAENDRLQENINLLAMALNVKSTSRNDSTLIDATKMGEKNPIEAANKEDKAEEPDVKSSKNESLQAHENILVDNDENPSLSGIEIGIEFIFNDSPLIEDATPSLVYNACLGDDLDRDYDELRAINDVSTWILVVHKDAKVEDEKVIDGMPLMRFVFFMKNI